MHFPFKFAVVDLGTNSVRFDIYSLDSDKVVRRIHRERQMIRLGDGLYATHLLSRGAIRRTLLAFEHIHQILQLYQVHRVRILATSALRSAKNRHEIIRVVQAKFNLKIEVISGAEEARLIAQGILHVGKLPLGPFALVDIGGGSTEITFCHGRKVLECFSVPLGALRLQQIFLKTSPPKPRPGCRDPIATMRQHVAKKVSAIRGRYPNVRTVLGSSGTFVSIEKVLKKSRANVSPFGFNDLSHLVDVLSRMKQVEILSVPGMDYKRADIILAGGLLLEEIMKQLSFRKVFVTDFALRDGIFLEEIHTIQKLLRLKKPPALSN